jgi:hypothetical protein
MKMPFRYFLIVFLFSFVLPASAQKFTHLAKAHYVKFTGKEIYMLGYDVSTPRMCFSISAGAGRGSDKQFLDANQTHNPREKMRVRDSQTIFPERNPLNSFLESCVSEYKIQQLRIGFTVFIRNNELHERAACTGPHFGVEAMFSKLIESQTVVYKSDDELTRFEFSGVNKFNAAGVGTHFGWQFAFFSDRLYIDVRAVIPFYYPFMQDPNLNSPFSGNKYELQASIGWHLYRVKKTSKSDGETERVREKI